MGRTTIVSLAYETCGSRIGYSSACWSDSVDYWDKNFLEKAMIPCQCVAKYASSIRSDDLRMSFVFMMRNMRRLQVEAYELRIKEVDKFHVAMEEYELMLYEREEPGFEREAMKTIGFAHDVGNASLSGHDIRIDPFAYRENDYDEYEF